MLEVRVTAPQVPADRPVVLDQLGQGLPGVDRATSKRRRPDRRWSTPKRRATGTFTIKGWDEQPWTEVEGAPKLTQARVTAGYTGDLKGEGVSGLLMLYDGDDATYAGYERVVGSLDGRSGSFVLRLDDGFEQGAARTAWTVVEGTGTGDLVTLRGDGGYVAKQSEPEVAFELRWSLG